MSHESRVVNPGRQYNSGVKLTILQYKGVIVSEDDLWLFVSWPDVAALELFQDARMPRQPQRERKEKAS